MSTCHKLANVARMKVSKENMPIRLANPYIYSIIINNIVHYKYIKEVMRLKDVRDEVEKYVEEKFKNHRFLVDLNARTGFTGGLTKAQIKFTFGFNPHSVREKIINEGK